MTQFAVFRNPRRTEFLPFLLQIQNSRLDRSSVRVVMPLMQRSSGAPADAALTPHLVVQGIAVWADPMNLATVQRRLLGSELEILADPDQDRIIRAIDELISRG